MSISAMVLGLPGGPPIIAVAFYVVVGVAVLVMLAVKFKVLSRERVMPVVEKYFGQIQPI